MSRRMYDCQLTYENIEKLTKEKGWSKARLARELGITPQAIYNWLKEGHSPSIDNLVAMSGLFHVSLDEVAIYTEIDEPEENGR